MEKSLLKNHPHGLSMRFACSPHRYGERYTRAVMTMDPVVSTWEGGRVHVKSAEISQFYYLQLSARNFGLIHLT